MRSEKQTARLALALLSIALLAGSAYPLVTEDLDIIWTIPGDTSLDAFGASLASGDVNGDGIPDLIVASDTYDWNHAPDPLRGTVNVYWGSQPGATVPDLVLRSPIWKGSNPPVLACGDLNGDGFADIAVGEDMADDAYGICTIWMGGNPMDTTPYSVIHGRDWWLEAHLGRSVSVGDVNGDGYDDLVVGAFYSAEQPGRFGTGRVYVYYGGLGFDSIPDVTLLGGHDGEYEGFGIGVSAEADFDHDGYHDIYVGAWQYGSDQRGRMYVYYGGNPMDTSYDMAMSGEGLAHFLGFEEPGALNAQGSFDYSVEGNELWPDGAFDPGDNCGKVYIHQGGRPMDSVPDISIIGRMDSANLGYSAKSAGDATGDGNHDLVAGAPYSWPSGATGAAYLWETGSHFDTVPDAWMMGEAPEQVVGERVCAAGDLDGDGRSEFMVSNYSSDLAKCVWVCKYTGLGVQEEEAVGVNARALRVWPSVVNRQLNLAGWNRAVLLDASGSKVLDLKAGANSVRGLAPGIYFVREQGQAQASAVRKVVVTR
jgi:hypothetical protein